jgi:hypothetical protein
MRRERELDSREIEAKLGGVDDTCGVLLQRDVLSACSDSACGRVMC